MKLTKSIVGLLWLFCGQIASAESTFPVESSIAGDIVAPVYTSVDNERGFDLNVRSIEVSLSSAVDKIFAAQISFAGHNENGEFPIELHEGFLSTGQFASRSIVKVGKFFLGLGHLNQTHQHAWNFITAPKSHQTFFSEIEGVSDSGVEASSLLPISTFVEFKAGVTRNYCYGHCHGDVAQPPRPLFYLRPSVSFDLSSYRDLNLGLNYLNRRNSSAVTTQLIGVDSVYKVKSNERLKWLHEIEVFYEHESAAQVSTSRQLGGYYLAQYGLTPSWFVGLRFDGFSELSRKFVSTNGRRKNFDYAIVPIATWRASDHSHLRFSYTYECETLQGSKDSSSQLAQLQLVFEFGSAHSHDH